MKLLLAIDHSAESKTAIDEVAARPWPADTSVEVISVVDTKAPWLTSEVIEEITRRTTNLVERAAAQLTSRGLSATAQAFAGDPKEAIVGRAEDLRPDLLIAGPHGAGETAIFLLGSVAKAIVR